MPNLNGLFGSMFNKYHLATCNCMVQGIADPFMCNMSKLQLCQSLCQTKVTSNTCPQEIMVVGLLPDLIVGRLSHFTLGNPNSHSCKIYFAGSNYNCIPNTILSNIYSFPI
jgi:hypothetical protein